jgi:hypothetical protein
MRRPVECAVTVVAAVFSFGSCHQGTALAQEPAVKLAGVPDGYVQWLYPVAYPQSADKTVESAAGRLSQGLGLAIEPIKAKQNPGCCFWLRIEDWIPNPGTDGFVIIVQPGGAQLLAASANSMKNAVDHIERVKHVQDGKVFLPTGLMTSYKVVQRDHAMDK